MITYFFYLFHTVRTEDNSSSIFGEIVNFIFDEIGVYRIETAEWFIEDDELRFMYHPTYKLQFLAHAFRKIFHFFVPPGFHIQSLEPGFYFCCCLAFT